MQVEKKVFCHWDFVRFIQEKVLKQEDGTFLTLSVTDGDKVEFMIFLGKDDSTSDYEVRVYKSNPTDKYVPNEYDEVKRFEDNDEYATFFFEEFEQALHFTELVGYVHPEYRVRPARKIGEDN